MSYLGKAQNGVITVLLIAILVLLAWFFFLKPDPCLTKSRLYDKRQEAPPMFNGEPIGMSDAEEKAMYACMRSLKGVQR